ncbi:hypothetical protein GUITHDRAFT_120771 [Guillardia theta CCMP2712]|uniref:Uncharacterized protein n=1 Tax=Guillardia theta (strain CCMP2712) TaxID=905079 RepID=L1IAT6_GUITC|nr:hypothetical protein GUITHDRAFT_120771 [Guillardia theta CCMP2712]EKX33034.1 hypothetical protein GUITHDRAFT_120771 [Guillardia theta CCMP2712]|eukprot:XP_005820014.1 hypothetical protein GUITHDRAFT_120771 [Guillardia theta CCMP2712]
MIDWVLEAEEGKETERENAEDENLESVCDNKSVQSPSESSEQPSSSHSQDILGDQQAARRVEDDEEKLKTSLSNAIDICLQQCRAIMELQSANQRLVAGWNMAREQLITERERNSSLQALLTEKDEEIALWRKIVEQLDGRLASMEKHDPNRSFDEQ